MEGVYIMKRMNRKGYAVLGFGVILLVVIIIWFAFYNNIEKDEIERFEVELPRSTWIPLYESGKGGGATEDTYFIESTENSTITEVLPGKAYIQKQCKNKVKKMTRYIDGDWISRSRCYFDYHYIVLFDLETGEEIKKINTAEIIENTCPGFQPSGGDDAFLGIDGHYYFRLILENIPESAIDEEIEKILFIDVDTEETVVMDSEEMATEFSWARYEKEDEEYGETFKSADWETFEKLNGYDANAETFYTSVSRGGKGCIKVTVSCEALPQENDILYNRFPGLQKWVGSEGKQAVIYIGGYPTAEEVMEMFEKQEL